MTRSCGLLILLLPVTLLAETPASITGAYQDGTLTKVRTIVTANACSGSRTNDAAAYGNTARRNIVGSANCYDMKGTIYTVAVGGKEYDLSPARSLGARATAWLPLSSAFVKESSMANHLPGTPVKIRADDDGIFVLVGKRETRYQVFDAQ